MCGFIKEWIENWKEDKKRNSEIENPGNMSDLLKIVAMKDHKYVKEFIEYNEEILKECHINGDRAVDLIKTVGDPEYIKECLENQEKRRALSIKGNSTAMLIITVEEKEPGYIKECLENVEKMQALGIDSYVMESLITATKDIVYIKKLLKNKEKMQALGIKDDGVYILMKTVEDPEYIKECLGNKEPGYIKEYIKNQIKDEKNNELGSDFLAQVIMMTGDAEFINDCRVNNDLNPETRDLLDRFTKIPPITLPGQMTIGVEIESEGLASREEIEKIIGNLLKERTWELSSDITLINGTEAISPILRKDTASHEIYTVCNALYSLGQETSERCGGHIHIGADYLTDLQDWKNLRNIWNNTEKILYIISNRKGEIPRAGVLGYAQPISGKDESKQKTINLENESDLENFIAETKIIQGTRYSGINYVNVGEEEKNTIEFRLPNGTLDPTTWIENINLFGGLVRVSHELSEIMLKSAEQRTEEEKKMLYNYKVIQTEQDERKVAEALIGLCVSQEQMQTYLDRYDENSELLKKTPEINDGLKGQIRKNKIGKKTIPKINGVDLEEFSREVSKELEIINEREGESIDVK